MTTQVNCSQVLGGGSTNSPEFVIIKILAIYLSSQPFLGRQPRFHIFFHHGFLEPHHFFTTRLFWIRLYFDSSGSWHTHPNGVLTILSPNINSFPPNFSTRSKYSNGAVSYSNITIRYYIKTHGSVSRGQGNQHATPMSIFTGRKRDFHTSVALCCLYETRQVLLWTHLPISVLHIPNLSEITSSVPDFKNWLSFFGVFFLFFFLFSDTKTAIKCKVHI